jgi:iron complex outermembrane receptor protein
VINASADAIVKGVDFDGSFQITPHWLFSGAVSYADGRVDDQRIPCRDSNFDGVPDDGTPTVAQFQQRGIALARCISDRSVSRNSSWSGSAETEFRQPVGQVEAYLRGLLTYLGRNPNQNQGFTVPGYGLLNLYAGVRSPDGAWDVGLFARNVTNTGVETSRTPDYVRAAGDLTSIFGESGYRGVTYTPPREFGGQVRYSFGSR